MAGLVEIRSMEVGPLFRPSPAMFHLALRLEDRTRNRCMLVGPKWLGDCGHEGRHGNDECAYDGTPLCSHQMLGYPHPAGLAICRMLNRYCWKQMEIELAPLLVGPLQSLHWLL